MGLLDLVKAGNLTAVEELLREGDDLDINQTDNNGWTPLMWACKNNKVLVALVLVNNGADINIKNKDGKSARDYAKKRGFEKDLIESAKSVTPADATPEGSLHEASMEGRLDDIKRLVENGCDIDLKDEDGSTALLLASDNGFAEIVVYLGEQGANKDIQNSNGTTAVLKACSHGYGEIVEYFSSNGANLDVKNKFGDTALICACMNDHYEVVVSLVSAKADLSPTNNEGYTQHAHLLQ
jgi:ankyrin repeat protein